MRTLRCAAFAEKEGRGSKRKVTSDATLELLRTNSIIDRLKRRTEAIEDRREGYAVSDATHHSQASEETSCVTVEEASPPQQTSHQRPCQAAPAYAVPSIYYDVCHKLASDYSSIRSAVVIMAVCSLLCRYSRSV